MSTEKKKSTSGRPDPEITLKTERRRYSILRKLRILDHADACKDNKAELDELLQREDLSLFQLSNWRKQKAEGRLAAGIRKAKELDPSLALGLTAGPRSPSIIRLEGRFRPSLSLRLTAGPRFSSFSS